MLSAFYQLELRPTKLNASHSHIGDLWKIQQKLNLVSLLPVWYSVRGVPQTNCVASCTLCQSPRCHHWEVFSPQQSSCHGSFCEEITLLCLYLGNIRLAKISEGNVVITTGRFLWDVYEFFSFASRQPQIPPQPNPVNICVSLKLLQKKKNSAREVRYREVVVLIKIF